MSDLSIYDPPEISEQDTIKAPSTGFLKRNYVCAKSYVSCHVQVEVEKIRSTESMVLSTLHPVTKYIPISYDTMKRVGVIGLCTFSGFLQGRKRGGIRKFIYPFIGFSGGNASCYPKQSYQFTNKTAKTVLPLVAVAGKSVVDGGSSVFQQSSKLYSFMSERSGKPLEEEQSEEVGNTTEEILVTFESVFDCDEVITENTELEIDEANRILPLEKLAVPEEVPPIEENLGMGDREHDDMYSTRSAT